MNAMKRTACGAAIGAGLLLTQTALAQNPAPLPEPAVESVSPSMTVSQSPLRRHGQETVSVTISVKHLDLHDPEDAATLYSQILSAASKICWRSYPAYRVRGLAERTASRSCFDEAVDGALAQVRGATGLDIDSLAGLDRAQEVARVAAR